MHDMHDMHDINPFSYQTKPLKMMNIQNAKTQGPAPTPAPSPTPIAGKPGSPSTRTKKEQLRDHTKNLAFWTFLWVLTTAIVAFGPVFIWGGRPSGTWITVAAVVLNFSVGLMMISSNARHLRLQDELMQKVQLQAMAVTLGLSLVAGITFSLLDSTNLIRQDAEISVLVVFMAVTYMVSLGLNFRRYR